MLERCPGPELSLTLCAMAPKDPSEPSGDLVPSSRFDSDTCTYYFGWDSRAACAVRPQEVSMVNGTLTNPVTGKSFSLGDIYFK